MYKVFFITFGCKVNSYETDLMKSCFEKEDFEISDKVSGSDVVVVNSCTVTGTGESKSLYAVRKLRKDLPDAVIVLTGCVPQASPETASDVPEADLVTGTKDRAKIPELVLGILAERRRIVDISPYSSGDKFECIEYSPSDDHTRGFIKIQDGCNCFCTYCMIPYARGRCRSKPLDEIRREAEMLAGLGRREIVLTGINIAFYGENSGIRLVDAVEICCRTDGIERVRLGSIEPEMISQDDLRRLAQLPEFCPQFHLSLQSGSASVLRRMNRHYTPDEYLAITENIRSFFPDASFTTDIMVGFPEETDAEFEESLVFAEKIGFSRIHVFRYSPRKGTPAEKMAQVSEKVKTERAARMKSLGDRLAKRYFDSLVGKSVPVLFEREKSHNFHQGHAPDYTLIKISRKNYKKSLRNSIFYVTIEEAGSDCCYGSLSNQ